MDWEKVVEFLEAWVRRYRRAELLEEAHRILGKHPTVPEGCAVKSVREDRDSG